VTRQITTLLLGLALLAGVFPVYAADRPVLLELQKQEGLSSTRISLIFDRVPEFSSEHSGQRLDILLNNASVSKGLSSLPEDETVVKILLAEKGNDILASLLLRRPPKQIVSKSQEKPARIDFELYWDSARGSRPAVAFRIEGIPGVKGGRKLRDERKFPPWHENWQALFKADLTPWELDPKLNYSLPEIPDLAIEKPTPALKQRLELKREKRWLSLLRFLPEMPPVAENEKLQEELLIIEGLIRSDGLEAAAVRLRKLEDLQGGQKGRVDYLTDFVLAATDQAYAAFLKSREQLKTLSADDPFYPLMTLLAAEAAIASGNDKDTLSLLGNKEIVWSGTLEQIVLMRLGDANCGLGNYPQALIEYHKLINSTVLFDSYPRSRGRAAKAAFEVGDFRLAARLYKDLGRQIADNPLENLAFYAAAAANYNDGETEWAQIGLQKIYLEMPGTEGADRAALRMQDHQVLIGSEREQAEAIYKYAFLAKNSRVRVLREEASFKQALVLYLLGDSVESVKLLMDFRRAFASGALRSEADSLLSEQLPEVISALIDKGEDIQGVVLVEQNRALLLKQDLDKASLDRIAGALTRLGLFKRAARIILFQLDRAPDVSAREEFYMPLAQLYLLRQEYRAASDYAQTYLDTYQKGRMRGAIYGLMLDALEKQKRYEELLQQLERPDRPRSAALDIRAAWIYWEQQRIAVTVERLESALRLTGTLEVKEMALLAESLFQLGRDKEAGKFFQPLTQDKTFGPQASYRSAQLLLRKGKVQDGLNLLRGFVEKEKSGPWVLLAQDLLNEIRWRKF
jgi:hypothetical protein